MSTLTQFEEDWSCHKLCFIFNSIACINLKFWCFSWWTLYEQRTTTGILPDEIMHKKRVDLLSERDQSWAKGAESFWFFHKQNFWSDTHVYKIYYSKIRIIYWLQTLKMLKNKQLQLDVKCTWVQMEITWESTEQKFIRMSCYVYGLKYFQGISKLWNQTSSPQHTFRAHSALAYC